MRARSLLRSGSRATFGIGVGLAAFLVAAAVLDPTAEPSLRGRPRCPSSEAGFFEILAFDALVGRPRPRFALDDVASAGLEASAPSSDPLPSSSLSATEKSERFRFGFGLLRQ